MIQAERRGKDNDFVNYCKEKVYKFDELAEKYTISYQITYTSSHIVALFIVQYS